MRKIKEFFKSNINDIKDINLTISTLTIKQRIFLIAAIVASYRVIKFVIWRIKDAYDSKLIHDIVVGETKLEILHGDKE